MLKLLRMPRLVCRQRDHEVDIISVVRRDLTVPYFFSARVGAEASQIGRDSAGGARAGEVEQHLFLATVD